MKYSGDMFTRGEETVFLSLQNQKDPGAAEEEAGAAAAAVVAVVVVVVLEGADPPAWEDCSRLECRS